MPKSEPKTPIVQALESIVHKKVPSVLVRGCNHDFRPLSETASMHLQNWCASNVPVDWMTGLGVIEAAELLVAGAIENGNLK